MEKRFIGGPMNGELHILEREYDYYVKYEEPSTQARIDLQPEPHATIEHWYKWSPSANAFIYLETVQSARLVEEQT